MRHGSVERLECLDVQLRKAARRDGFFQGLTAELALDVTREMARRERWRERFAKREALGLQVKEQAKAETLEDLRRLGAQWGYSPAWAEIVHERRQEKRKDY